MAIRATYRHTIFEELCDALWASLSAQVHALGNPLARGDCFQEKTRGEKEVRAPYHRQSLPPRPHPRWQPRIQHLERYWRL